MNWTNVVVNLLILFAPFAAVVSGVAAVRGVRQDSADWHNRLSLVAVLFILAAAVLWPIVRAFAPPLPLQSDPAYLQAWDRAHKYIVACRWVGIGLCVSAFAASVFGRIRVILPVLMASTGTALFWWVSTTWPH